MLSRDIKRRFFYPIPVQVMLISRKMNKRQESSDRR